jgi:hypothetical protein
MPMRVKAVTILDDGQVNPIDRRTAVLAMNVKQLNVRVELDGNGVAPGALPNEIPIEIRAWEPKRRNPAMSSMDSPFTTTVKRAGTKPTYTACVDPATLAPLRKWNDGLLKVATVVREGGTSAATFRSILANKGWAMRGAARQPGKGKPDLTGNLVEEEPDAKTLFLAGGVEVLEVCVPASSGCKVGPNATTWMFIRSPANVFFYSGHGSWKTCNLLVEAPVDYDNWLAPEDVTPPWKQPGLNILQSPWWNLDVLIINGCGVLGDFGLSSGGAMSPCAARWRKLLDPTGPLVAILGYRDTAPSDRMDKGKVGGEQIARDMANAVVNGLGDHWDQYARTWLDINQKYGYLTGTAAAVDVNGYWFINQKMSPAAHTHEERPLPGFVPGPDEGKVFGPGPVPASKLL